MAARIDIPLPPLAMERGGGGSAWTELVTANDDIQASLLTGRLDAAGIETFTVKDRTAPGAWLLAGSNPWAPVKIYVRKLQYEDARLVVAEIALEADDTPTDPSAGPQLSWAWWITAVALGIGLTVLSLAQYLDGARP